jgi:hypothetical protein
MAEQRAHTDDEIDAAAMRAQKASFEAEDQGGGDEAAEAIYSFWQWMTGNRPDDPTEEMGESL